MKVAVYTLGCKVNQYESRALEELLSAAGAEIVERCADACIVNTCAVTAESERKCGQTVRRAIKENPGAYVLVTGCGTQVNAGKYQKIAGVDYICGSRNKKETVERILSLLKTGKKAVGCDLPDLESCGYEPMQVSSSERTRAYMKVEDGCDSKCAYCIIPRARGPVVSRPLEECVGEAKRLVSAGYREIVLTGIEISAYGQDLKNTDLTDLIRSLEEIEDLKRIRLSSIDPSFLRPGVVDKLRASQKLAHHFHLSLQSGCDRTLAAMRRKYNTALARRNIAYLQEAFPDVRFTADVIVGFPGETDGDFEQTLAFMRSLNGFLHVHVFSYSRRPQTEADGMPGQLSESVKSARSAQLIALCEEKEKETLKAEEGKTYEVLFESGKRGEAVGHTSNFIEVHVKTEEDPSDTVRNVRLTKSGGTFVWGEWI